MRYISIIMTLITATAAAQLSTLAVDVTPNTHDGKLHAGYDTAAIALTITPEGRDNTLDAGIIGAGVQICLVAGDVRYYWPAWGTEPSRSTINIPGLMVFELFPPVFWPAGLSGSVLTFEVSIHDQWGQERVIERTQAQEVEIK